MKNLLPLCIFSIMLLVILSACKKSESNSDQGCGCNSDSVNHYVTYNNFGGSKYNAGLFYDTFQNQNGWFISVGIPNTNYGALLKICNPELTQIRAITDTMNNKYSGIRILFSGKLKKLCPNESFGIQLPETITENVQVDSLKKQ